MSFFDSNELLLRLLLIPLVSIWMIDQSQSFVCFLDLLIRGTLLET